MKQPTFAPVYASLYPVLSEIAREHGYALSIHGSVVSDFDLIAVPWVEEAIEPLELVNAISDYVSLICGANHDLAPVKEPEQKPYGRLAWSIPMGAGAVIDLSITAKMKPDQILHWKVVDDKSIDYNTVDPSKLKERLLAAIAETDNAELKSLLTRYEDTVEPQNNLSRRLDPYRQVFDWNTLYPMIDNALKVFNF